MGQFGGQAGENMSMQQEDTSIHEAAFLQHTHTRTHSTHRHAPARGARKMPSQTRSAIESRAASARRWRVAIRVAIAPSRRQHARATGRCGREKKRDNERQRERVRETGAARQRPPTVLKKPIQLTFFSSFSHTHTWPASQAPPTTRRRP